MTVRFTESEVEEVARALFDGLGYAVLHGPDIAPGELGAERESYGEVVLARRFRQALQRLNPAVPAEALGEAFRKVARAESPSLVANNRAFHRMLVDGVEVEYRRADGSIAGDPVRLVDFNDPDRNDWLAVNQFTVLEGQHHRLLAVVVFVNGLPLGVVELKNPADENATIWTAFQQLQTYKTQIPSLFAFNETLTVSDGLEARIGTLTADRERFMPWRTIEGEDLASAATPQLDVLLRGVFEKRRLLDLVRHFIGFEDDGSGALQKKMAGDHPSHAVARAVAASSPRGDRRAGVAWHTQSSGKSLAMAFYAG